MEGTAMALFFVRVELHDATSKDYDVLHENMAKASYSRSIKDGAGSVFQLPTAEYARYFTATVDRVIEEVKKVAATTGKTYWVLVSEAAHWSGYLKKLS